jgi:hypothetical protein
MKAAELKSQESDSHNVSNNERGKPDCLGFFLQPTPNF